MAFSPSTASRETLISLSGWSLASTTGVYLFSGVSGAYGNIVSTGNNLITFYPPSNLSNFLGSGIRSGQVRIFNKYGSATETNWLTFADPVFLSGFTPGSGVTGSSIRLSGSGIRDISNLHFIVGNAEYTGVLSVAIEESNTWIRTGYIPFISGGLNAYVRLRIAGAGGSHSPSQLFYIREEGISLSGITNFPVPILAHQYLRGNSTADGLEWRTPSQVLGDDLTGVRRNGGDNLTGNYYLTGGAFHLTGLVIQNTGLLTGNTIFRSNIFSGNYLTLDAIIGGITWRAFSLKIS